MLKKCYSDIVENVLGGDGTNATHFKEMTKLLDDMRENLLIWNTELEEENPAEN
jgi:hypothetical protein